VLAAVFVPCCFLGGITGQFFRQFAVTIAVSTVISAVNALTMTPSRAVLIFKGDAKNPGRKHKHEARPWWTFAVLGAVFAYESGRALCGGQFGIPPAPAEDEARGTDWALVGMTALRFGLPGFLAGGLLGWFTIRHVNAVLAWFFGRFNRAFDRVTNL